MTLKNVVRVGCFIFALDGVASDGGERSGREMQKIFTSILHDALRHQSFNHKAILDNDSLGDGEYWINIRLNDDRLYKTYVKHGDSEKIALFCSTANIYLTNSTPENSQVLRDMLGMPAGTFLNCATLQQYLTELKARR